MNDVKQTVEEIILNVGGESNIQAATHCVTRLRLVLNDESKVNIEEIESLDMVKGSFSASGQFQIVIGPGVVDRVYAEFMKQTSVNETTTDEIKENANKDTNVLQRGVRLLADIFIPILPAIVASGLLMGLNNMISNPGIFFEQSLLEAYPAVDGFAGIINIIANTAFTFMPALIGWSTMKKFGGSPIIGVVFGLILVHPDLMNVYEFAADPSAAPTWNIFGFEVNQVGYQGQVLPVLIATYILAKLELFFTKIVPDTFKLILVAPLSLLITGFITFTLIGPITMAGSDMITDGILWLFEVQPTLAGAVYGFISPPLVITGMHHLFLGVNLQMAGTLGYVTLWPIGETVTMAQAIGCMTIFFLMKENKKTRSIALTATASALLGITEPAIYGINLRYKYPFIGVMFGSAAGSAFLAFQDVRATSVGVGGIFSFLSVFPEHWLSYFIGYLITFVVTVGLTLILSRTKLANEPAA